MILADGNSLIAAKHNETADSALSIPIVSKDGATIGALVCLDRRLCNDDAIIANLVAWRQRYMHCFLTQFTATQERTRRWLTDAILPASDRILFLIQDRDGRFIGNIGLCNMSPQTAEIDNVLRGEKSSTADIMEQALRCLLAAAFASEKREAVSLHVFSNNDAAIRLYARVGFTKDTDIALMKQINGDGLTLIPSPDAEGDVDFRYMKMSITKERLIA